MNDAIRTEETGRDDDIVVAVRGVSKKLCRSLKRSMLYAATDVGAECLGLAPNRSELRTGEFWALRNVDLTLRRGESLGLVGANGAGKTTLLRLISGLIRPDQGSIHVRGRLAPLLAMGAGFNPVLSGRENIDVNLALLGVPPKRIRERVDAVIDFAEIAHAIDAPIRTYSSGMLSRLGFACAVHTDPDIMLIDEVLAVGDLRFRLKCYRRLRELRERGTSFILVAHQPQVILSACEHAAYLAAGNVVDVGDANDVMMRYERDQLGQAAGQGAATRWEFPPDAGHDARIVRVDFADPVDGSTLTVLEPGTPVRLRVEVDAQQALPQVQLFVGIQDQALDDERVLQLFSDHDDARFDLVAGRQTIVLDLDPFGLRPGAYSMKLSVRTRGFTVSDMVEGLRFTVAESHRVRQSMYFQPRRWFLQTTGEPPPRGNTPC